METEAPIFDENPTWAPEEVDKAYMKLGDDCDDKKYTDSGYWHNTAWEIICLTDNV